MLRRVRAGAEQIEYQLIQTARSNVEIRVLPAEVRVFAPKGYPLKRADAFVSAHAGWIREARSRYEAYRTRRDEMYPMTDGMPVPVEGKTLYLRVERAERPYVGAEDGLIAVRLPDPSPEAVAEALRQYLIGLARTRIEERVGQYAPLIGRSPRRVTIREQRTKWGSCSTQGNLNFNWKLIMAPPEALTYVVIHELCHLYEFNHSARFWARVARYQPEYAVWRDFLRSGWAHPYP